MIDIDGQKYLTPKEISKEWGLKPPTIREYCNNGLIPKSFKNKHLHYIPSGAIKPKPEDIKAALSLYLLQSSLNTSEETLREIFCNPLFIARINYLQDINFITVHTKFGSGRYELTEQGMEYLFIDKKKTIIGNLRKNVRTMEFKGEISLVIPGSVISLKGETIIHLRDS